MAVYGGPPKRHGESGALPPRPPTPGHKSPPPPQRGALGSLYDLDANTVSLPADKVTSLLSLLSEWSKRTHANERQLASLAGKLLSAAQVIWCGRLFTNNILACKRLATSINRQILLDEAFFEDVRWWQLAIAERNGVSFLELPTAYCGPSGQQNHTPSSRPPLRILLD